VKVKVKVKVRAKKKEIEPPFTFPFTPSLDVSCRRALVAEVAEDLEQRAGLRAAFPADDPELAAALIARLADGGASAKLAARRPRPALCASAPPLLIAACHLPSV